MTMNAMGWLVAALAGFVCLFVGIAIGGLFGFREGEQTDSNEWAAAQEATRAERDAVPRRREYIQ